MYRYVVLLIAMLLLGACSSDKDENEYFRSGNPTPGDTAPDFTLPTSDGETVTLSDYKEPVLLFFHMAEG